MRVFNVHSIAAFFLLGISFLCPRTSVAEMPTTENGLVLGSKEIILEDGHRYRIERVFTDGFGSPKLLGITTIDLEPQRKTRDQIIEVEWGKKTFYLETAQKADTPELAKILKDRTSFKLKIDTSCRGWCSDEDSAEKIKIIQPNGEQTWLQDKLNERREFSQRLEVAVKSKEKQRLIAQAGKDKEMELAKKKERKGFLEVADEVWERRQQQPLDKEILVGPGRAPEEFTIKPNTEIVIVETDLSSKVPLVSNFHIGSRPKSEVTFIRHVDIADLGVLGDYAFAPDSRTNSPEIAENLRKELSDATNSPSVLIYSGRPEDQKRPSEAR
jgi:hypothetical protein